MAQISIPMSNKVGYSMYWNSMWDSKINYSRVLKEDIYLNIFVPLIFNDKISSKILKTVEFKKIIDEKTLKKYNLNVRLENLKFNHFHKFIFNLNSATFFKSKVWILKYQKWVIIYFFMYIPKFGYLKNKNNFDYFIKKNNQFGNISDIFSIYKKINFNLKYSYKFFNKKLDKNYF